MVNIGLTSNRTGCQCHVPCVFYDLGTVVGTGCLNGFYVTELQLDPFNSELSPCIGIGQVPDPGMSPSSSLVNAYRIVIFVVTVKSCPTVVECKLLPYRLLLHQFPPFFLPDFDLQG